MNFFLLVISFITAVIAESVARSGSQQSVDFFLHHTRESFKNQTIETAIEKCPKDKNNLAEKDCFLAVKHYYDQVFEAYKPLAIRLIEAAYNNTDGRYFIKDEETNKWVLKRDTSITVEKGDEENAKILLKRLEDGLEYTISELEKKASSSSSLQKRISFSAATKLKPRPIKVSRPVKYQPYVPVQDIRPLPNVNSHTRELIDNLDTLPRPRGRNVEPPRPDGQPRPGSSNHDDFIDDNSHIRSDNSETSNGRRPDSDEEWEDLTGKEISFPTNAGKPVAPKLDWFSSLFKRKWAKAVFSVLILAGVIFIFKKMFASDQEAVNAQQYGYAQNDSSYYGDAGGSFYEDPLQDDDLMYAYGDTDNYSSYDANYEEYNPQGQFPQSDYTTEYVDEQTSLQQSDNTAENQQSTSSSQFEPGSQSEMYPDIVDSEGHIWKFDPEAGLYYRIGDEGEKIYYQE